MSAVAYAQDTSGVNAFTLYLSNLYLWKWHGRHQWKGCSIRDAQRMRAEQAHARIRTRHWFRVIPTLCH